MRGPVLSGSAQWAGKSLPSILSDYRSIPWEARLLIYLSFVPSVVFPTGVVEEGKTLLVYYGAADAVTAVAELSLRELVESMDAPAADKNARSKSLPS